MNQDAQKKAVAEAALKFLPEDGIIGVGTGSTVNFFIDALAAVKNRIEGAVATSNKTAQKLKALGIPLQDLNSVGELPIYVDGADEINAAKQMIKGGGGALTQEKIVATAAKKFICIADASKRVDMLGAFPVAIEVIPMARSLVARHIVTLGGDPVYREGFVTDNGNVILDVYNLKLLDPVRMEQALKALVGVVENGIFARRTADIVLMSSDRGVEQW